MLPIKLKPYLSEKSNMLSESNKIVFLNLGPRMNKIQWKHYFKSTHDITVSAVHNLTKPSKKRRRGRIMGKTVPRQKVIITVTDDTAFEKLKALAV